jgi:hypothetical protein
MKVIISGCIKNSGKYVNKVFENIKIICENFNIIKIICSYDKSSDNTLFELYKQKKIFKNKLKIIINKNKLSNERVINISNARNRILDYIEKEKLQSDYLIMMDMDDVCSPKIDIDVLKYAFKIKNKWDILTFKNDFFYDYWALSFDNYIFSNIHVNNYTLLVKKMVSILYEKSKNNELIDCLSSFNCFGIYKMSKIKNIKYESKIPINFYTKNYIKSIKKVEKELNIQYYLNNEYIYDCEHRYYQIMCNKKNKTRNKILIKNLFPGYNGDHKINQLKDIYNTEDMLKYIN